MKKYRVVLKETIYFPPKEVEAESPDDAENKVRSSWLYGEMTGDDSELDFDVEELCND